MTCIRPEASGLPTHTTRARVDSSSGPDQENIAQGTASDRLAALPDKVWASVWTQRRDNGSAADVVRPRPFFPGKDPVMPCLPRWDFSCVPRGMTAVAGRRTPHDPARLHLGSSLPRDTPQAIHRVIAPRRFSPSQTAGESFSAASCRAAACAGAG